MTRLLLAICLLATPALGAQDWRRPFISDVFFYWYLYDREKEWGWDAGVHFTPLYGYYDSRTFKDNRHSLWLASEWGMTHHFIDYWSPHWKGEDGQMREKTVFRAAESLRKDGYDIAMAYYQDGSNFAMDAFSKNVAEKRDVHQWLRDFARSPVWPRVGRRGRPLQLVYSRNGSPKITATDDGFRAWLRRRYKSIDGLNRAWDASVKSFDEVRLDFGYGRPRADAIRYQYHVWQAEWDKLDGLVQGELKLPGVAASFDVGYKPYLGHGRSLYFRTFGGPHSYGGIFAQPHDQDAHRFLCSILAKKHDTVFFDHLKHCYHDWNIRVPGTAYLPDPFHFDRFWVGNLMRFNEGVLHMSWNEWWEGSNLEPSMELGKTYCEKNLFYSTLMQRCFPSIRDWGKGSQIALILNDWHLLTNEGRDDDLFAAVTALRRLGARFDILPEERVTADALKPFQLVIAPGCDSGFGENDQRQDIHKILLDWCKKGGKLWASANPRLASVAGLKPRPTKATTAKGKDFNLFIDVGVAGDERFLLSGASHREDWGKLPPGKHGAGTNLTVRWTPGSGTLTRLALPTAPNRDHALRLSGSALRPHTATVLIDNRPAGTLAIKPGLHDYDLPVPARHILGRQHITLTLRYERPMVPKELDPKQWPTESRSCNLAIDWLQWSTANIPKGDLKTTYVAPALDIRFLSPLFGPLLRKSVKSTGLRCSPLAAPNAEPLSIQLADRAARDILLPLDKGQLLYTNGRFSDFVLLDYWQTLLARWAAVPPPRPVVANESVMAARLDTDDTTLLLAINEDIPPDWPPRPVAKGGRGSRRADDGGAPPPARAMGGRGSVRAADHRRKLRLRLPARDLPLSEALVLSRDGKTHVPLKTRIVDGHVLADDALDYYGVYQFAFAPVRIITPKLEVCQGEKTTIAATIENLTDKPVRGTIRIACVVPTLGGPPAEVTLAPREKKQIALTIESSKLCDWGTKTVTIELAFNGRRAHLFRPCFLLRRPDIQLDQPIVDAQRGRVRIINKPSPHAVNATAEDIRVSLGPSQAGVPTLGSGRRASVVLAPRATSVHQPELRPVALDVSGRVAGGRTFTKRLTAHLAVCPDTFDAPTDAVQPIVVFNRRDTWLDHGMVSFEAPHGGNLFVRTAEGKPAAAYQMPSGAGRQSLVLSAVVPPRSARVFFVCRTEKRPVPPTPLRVRASGLGTEAGKLIVSNARFEATLDEARGGTMTRLVSKRTGRQYAAESFGAAYGRFGGYDPRNPATSSVKFVHQDLERQADGRANVKLHHRDPWRAGVEVSWRRGPCRASQSYLFFPWHEGFLVSGSGKLDGPPAGRELVLMDARFRAEHFTKTYPNFVGIVRDGEQPHFGWRRGTWVPDCLTFAHPPDFTESLSLLRLETLGVKRVRHGFWPKDRPRPGQVAYAWAEYIADRQKGAMSTLGLEVLLHRGYQLHARRLGRLLAKHIPVALTPKRFKWGKRFEPVDVAFPKGWFSPYWGTRLVVPLPKRKGTVAVAVKPLTEKMGGRPKWFRCVQANAEADLAEREFEVSEDGETLLVDVDPRWGATLHVYASREELPSPLRLETRPAGIRLEHFEKPAAGWELGRLRQDGVGREGSKGIRLVVDKGGAPKLITSRSLALQPEAAYRLTFWARSTTPGAELRANFFSGPKHDFQQEAIPIQPDGKWRQYGATVRTGKFPPSVRPLFRLWALGRPQTIDLDDVSLTPLKAPPAPALLPAGKVERLW